MHYEEKRTGKKKNVTGWQERGAEGKNTKYSMPV